MSRTHWQDQPAREALYRKICDRLSNIDSSITWLLVELRALQKRVDKLEKYHNGFSTSAALRKLAHDNVERVRELEQRGDLPSQEDGDKTLGCAPATTGL